MNLQQLKQEIDKIQFSGEVKDQIEEIVERSEKAGAMTEEDQREIVRLITLDMDNDRIEKEYVEDSMWILGNLAASIGNAVDMAEEEIDKAGEDGN